MGETGTHIDMNGKVALVTGGTGTVGSGIVRRLLETGVDGIRIFSRDEHKQYELRHELHDESRLRFLIGDTRDLRRLRRAVAGVNVIFHAAAMKHVLSCEYNPFEAVRTNIVGTQNVIDAALDAGVERVLFASSDKAVNPTSTMGTSKLMAEKLMSAADVFRGDHPTIFTTVRFGNVIGSRGSVVPLFLRQIAAGGPMTITDRRMTRFIMSLEHAVDLMFTALGLARGGEVFVLKMPVLRIEDLASLLRDHVAALHGWGADEIAIEEIGQHVGEKVAEELLTEEERARALETDEMFIIPPQLSALHPERVRYEYEGARPVRNGARSDAATAMTRDELYELLVSTNLLAPL